MRSSRLIWRGSSRFFFRATGKRSRPVREAADFQFAGSGLADDFTTPGSEGDSFDRRAAGGAATASDAAAGSQANPRRNRERSYRSLQRCAAGDAAGGGGKGRRSPDGPSDAAPSPGPARLGSPRFHPGWLFAGDVRSDARQAMPLAVAEKVADRLMDHLMQHPRQALPGWDRRVFILDGSSLEMPDR